MGSVCRKHYTRPLWPGAKLVTRGSKTWAEWRDRKGRKRKAEAVPDGKGGWRVRVPTGVYYADYRDAAGVTRVVSTGCKTESGARAVLAELERQAELVRSGVLSHTEAAVAERATEPVETHLADYLAGLEAKGTSPVYRENVRRFLRRLFADCGFLRLSDLDPVPVERWLSARLAEGMSARTRNEYRVVLIGFANWAVRSGRLLRNPFVSLPVADERSDRRRERRALTVDEFRRLVYVARWRPLAERGREPQAKPKRPGKRTSWTYKSLMLGDMLAAVERARDRFADRPETIERLDAEGRERALLYRVLVYTGLRKNEAATLQAGDLHLAGDPPYLKLRATNEKNRRGSVIPLRRDLADAIRAHLAEKHGLSGTESPAIVKFDPHKP